MTEPTSEETVSFSFATSNEAISNERLKWLWENNLPVGDHTSGLTADEVAEALQAVAAERVRVEQAEQLRNVALAKLERYRRALTRERDANATSNEAITEAVSIVQAWISRCDAAAETEAHGRPWMDRTTGRVIGTVHNFDKAILPMDPDEAAAVGTVLAALIREAGASLKVAVELGIARSGERMWTGLANEKLEERDQARAELANARARLDDLQRAAAAMLNAFVHKTHPGAPCMQSRHVDMDEIQRWREVVWPSPKPAADKEGGP